MEHAQVPLWIVLAIHNLLGIQNKIKSNSPLVPQLTTTLQKLFTPPMQISADYKFKSCFNLEPHISNSQHLHIYILHCTCTLLHSCIVISCIGIFSYAITTSSQRLQHT